MEKTNKHRRKRAAAPNEPEKTAPEDAHLGATEEQVVPTLSPGSNQPVAEPRKDGVNEEIDPTDELTPG